MNNRREHIPIRIVRRSAERRLDTRLDNIERERDDPARDAGEAAREEERGVRVALLRDDGLGATLVRARLAAVPRLQQHERPLVDTEVRAEARLAERGWSQPAEDPPEPSFAVDVERDFLHARGMA